MTLGELGGVENSVLGLSRVDMLFGGELDKEGELTIVLLVSSKSTEKKTDNGVTYKENKLESGILIIYLTNKDFCISVVQLHCRIYLKLDGT